MNNNDAINKANTKTLFMTLGILFVMAMLVVASVPLYQMFCQATGYGGSTNVAEYSPDPSMISDRELTVRFNADVNGDLPWYFRPVQNKVKVKIGEEALVFFKAVNNSDHDVTGVATFNVTPFKTAYYFNKIECFCFTEQTLKPGEEVDMAVSFYIDPEFIDDENLDEIKELTLSYTFFKSDDYDKQFE